MSPFSVRIPSLLFGLLYLCSIWKISRPFPITAVLGAAIPLAFDWFAQADGTGAAVALMVCAMWLTIDRKMAGACLGLAGRRAARFCDSRGHRRPWNPSPMRRNWAEWADPEQIPAAVAAVMFLLVLPLSHAHAAPESIPDLTLTQAAHLHSALSVLRASAGTKPIRIGATATPNRWSTSIGPGGVPMLGPARSERTPRKASTTTCFRHSAGVGPVNAILLCCIRMAIFCWPKRTDASL